MDPMERLFGLYNAHFDRLDADVARLNREKPRLNYGPVQARRLTRDEFERYLLNGLETETKRCFLRRIVEGDAEICSLLPENLKSLAARAA